MKEKWVTIPDWDKYEISNKGNLRSKDRLVIRNGTQYLKKGKMLNPGFDKYGYRVFQFKQDGKCKHLKIHRIVALCFIPNPDNKPCVNHIDNNPSNNVVTNLEWVTMKENTAWMIKQGRFKRNEEWLNKLHKAQEKTYIPVKGTNIKTGEILYFKNLNSVREKGFEPSCVCVCCKHKKGIKQHKGYTWEYIREGE